MRDRPDSREFSFDPLIQLKTDGPVTRDQVKFAYKKFEQLVGDMDFNALNQGVKRFEFDGVKYEITSTFGLHQIDIQTTGGDAALVSRDQQIDIPERVGYNGFGILNGMHLTMALNYSNTPHDVGKTYELELWGSLYSAVMEDFPEDTIDVNGNQISVFHSVELTNIIQIGNLLTAFDPDETDDYLVNNRFVSYVGSPWLIGIGGDNSVFLTLDDFKAWVASGVAGFRHSNVNVQTQHSSLIARDTKAIGQFCAAGAPEVSFNSTDNNFVRGLATLMLSADKWGIRGYGFDSREDVAGVAALPLAWVGCFKVDTPIDPDLPLFNNPKEVGEFLRFRGCVGLVLLSQPTGEDTDYQSSAILYPEEEIDLLREGLGTERVEIFITELEEIDFAFLYTERKVRENYTKAMPVLREYAEEALSELQLGGVNADNGITDIRLWNRVDGYFGEYVTEGMDIITLIGQQANRG